MSDVIILDEKKIIKEEKILIERKIKYRTHLQQFNKVFKHLYDDLFKLNSEVSLITNYNFASKKSLLLKQIHFTIKEVEQLKNGFAGTTAKDHLDKALVRYSQFEKLINSCRSVNDISSLKVDLNKYVIEQTPWFKKWYIKVLNRVQKLTKEITAYKSQEVLSF